MAEVKVVGEFGGRPVRLLHVPDSRSRKRGGLMFGSMIVVRENILTRPV